MSRIFKATRVNLGEPKEVALEDTEFLLYRDKLLAELEEQEKDQEDAEESPKRALSESEIIENANLKASEIINDVNLQANQIKEAVRQEAENEKVNILEQARQQGYKEGFEKGLKDGKKETEDLAYQALRIKEDLEIERQNLASEIEGKLPEIIMECVKKVIAKELSTDKEVVVSMVIEALNKANISTATVRVSHLDSEAIEENKVSIVSQCEIISDLEIKSDKSLKEGSVIIETDCGEIDAGVQTKLRLLEETINNIPGIDNDEECN